MANPQLENGYTELANEILEQLPRYKLNGTQYSIIMVVWRSTYGWKKKGYEISESYISKATGINVKQVSRELKTLIDNKLINVVRDATRTTPRVISFNKNYSEWQLISRVVTKKRGGNELEGTCGSELVGSCGSELVGEKRNIKTNIKNKEDLCPYKDLFDYYMQLELKKHRSYTKAMTNSIKKAMRENKYSIEDCKTLLKRHEEVVEQTKGHQYQVKLRGLDEFFGQKVHGATHLICSEYEEGGSKYEKYLKENGELNKRHPSGMVNVWAL